MKKITVIATPKAYEILTDANNKKLNEQFAKDLLEVIKDGFATELNIDDCPLGISAIWAKNQTDENFILVYEHKGHFIFHNMNEEMFLEKLETGIQLYFDLDALL